MSIRGMKQDLNIIVDGGVCVRECVCVFLLANSVCFIKEGCSRETTYEQSDLNEMRNESCECP